MSGVGIGLEGLNITIESRVLTDFKFTENMADVTLSRMIDKLAASEALLKLT